jgi:hypothetical protein
MDEVSYALDEGKLVIPVLYRDCVIPFRMRRLQFVDFRTDYGLPLQSLLQVLARQPREPGGGNLPQEPPVVPSQAGSPGSAETIPTRDASVLTRKTAVGRPHEASSFVDPSQPGPGDVDLRSDRPPGFFTVLVQGYRAAPTAAFYSDSRCMVSGGS